MEKWRDGDEGNEGEEGVKYSLEISMDSALDLVSLQPKVHISATSMVNVVLERGEME